MSIIVSHQLQSRDEWKIVFCISSLIYLFGALFYGIFASGERQPWALDEQTSKKQYDSSKDDKNVVYYNNHAKSSVPEEQ